MKVKEKNKITVYVAVTAPVDMVWEVWTSPEHITRWNAASEDWHTPRAENDLRPEGKFIYRMEAKDGSTGFDFWGVYETVEKNKIITFILGDGRRVEIRFSTQGNNTEIEETFDAENEHTLELQRNGWQSILNNFKRYIEKLS